MLILLEDIYRGISVLLATVWDTDGISQCFDFIGPRVINNFDKETMDLSELVRFGFFVDMNPNAVLIGMLDSLDLELPCLLLLLARQ